MRIFFLPLSLILLCGCGQAPDMTTEPLPYRNWESSSVTSNGIRLHYWRSGGDKPVMIMAHGITDYGLNWAGLAAKFEHGYDIIMYDARGHGFSEKPAGPYDLETHVADLAGLIEALEIRNPVLVGHSMGGSIVGLTAATYPDLPAAVIMEDPPMEEMLENMSTDTIRNWKTSVATRNLMPKMELMERARTEFHPGWTDFEYDHWAESKRLVSPNVIDILDGDGFGDPRAVFQRIIAPTLILKADPGNDVFANRHLEAAALLPDGRLVHVEGAGHVIRNDQPEAVEREIRDFLDGIETRERTNP